MIYELNHFGIVVRDLDASLAFYRELFGAEVVFEGFIPSSETDVRYLQISGGLIELLHPHDPGPEEVFGITHIAFLSDALDEDYARLVENGYEGLVAPKVAGTGVGRLSFLRDADGARVELLQRDVRMRKDIDPHPFVEAFDHYGVVVEDRDAALRFYRDELGLAPLVTLDGSSDGSTVDYLHYDYDVVGLIHAEPSVSDGTVSGRPAPLAHLALRVSSLDGARQAIARAGFEVEAAGPNERTSAGDAIVTTDPDGVRVLLVERPGLVEL